MKRKYKIKNLVIFFILLPFSFMGCKKFIDVAAPINTVNAENVYESDANATAVLTGIYINFSKDNNTISYQGAGLPLMSYYPALSADELTLSSGSTDPALVGYYQNSLSDANTGSTDFWNKIYSYVYTANAAIEGLSKARGLTPVIKNQLLGEAYFIRAFCYFYLVNLYGNVPLITGSDYKANAALSRTDGLEIYKLIKGDLVEAQNLLSENYLDGTLLKNSTDRIRPNKYAATALLARVYLYTDDNINAEIEASKVINKVTLYDYVSLNEVFAKNSKETIWGLQPVGVGENSNTGEGRLFILPSEGPDGSTYPVYLSDELMSAFEPNDPRLKAWIGSVDASGTIYNFAYKYKIGSVDNNTEEYAIVLRLAEQYLIRAEARARQNNISGGVGDLNVIRKRARGAAGSSVLPNVPSSISQNDLITAVLHERQVELFTEWGHRWLDIKRTNTADEVMQDYTPKKGGIWKRTSLFYPIRGEELEKGINLVQTPGY